jgi:predicted enzyme related to lactoylglutathione lyase
MEVSHFRLLVSNFTETFSFYRTVLELPTTYPDDAAGPYAEFELGGDRYLGLFDRKLMSAAVELGEAALDVPDDRILICISVTNVDDEAERLAQLGIDVLRLPADHEPWEMRTTYIRDPEGNLIEFYSPIKSTSAERA